MAGGRTTTQGGKRLIIVGACEDDSGEAAAERIAQGAGDLPIAHVAVLSATEEPRKVLRMLHWEMDPESAEQRTTARLILGTAVSEEDAKRYRKLKVRGLQLDEGYRLITATALDQEQLQTWLELGMLPPEEPEPGPQSPELEDLEALLEETGDRPTDPTGTATPPVDPEPARERSGPVGSGRRPLRAATDRDEYQARMDLLSADPEERPEPAETPRERTGPVGLVRNPDEERSERVPARRVTPPQTDGYGTSGYDPDREPEEDGGSGPPPDYSRERARMMDRRSERNGGRRAPGSYGTPEYGSEPRRPRRAEVVDDPPRELELDPGAPSWLGSPPEVPARVQLGARGEHRRNGDPEPERHPSGPIRGAGPDLPPSVPETPRETSGPRDIVEPLCSLCGEPEYPAHDPSSPPQERVAHGFRPGRPGQRREPGGEDRDGAPYDPPRRGAPRREERDEELRGDRYGGRPVALREEPPEPRRGGAPGYPAPPPEYPETPPRDGPRWETPTGGRSALPAVPQRGRGYGDEGPPSEDRQYGSAPARRGDSGRLPRTPDAPYMQHLPAEQRGRQRAQEERVATYGGNMEAQRRKSRDVVYFTGPNGGCGKTTTSFVAAQVLAECYRHLNIDRKVWLIEADYTNPKLEERIDSRGRHLGNVARAIADDPRIDAKELEAAIMENVVVMEDTGLYVLPCQYRLMESKAMVNLAIEAAIALASRSGAAVIVDAATLTSSLYDELGTQVIGARASKVVVVTDPGHYADAGRSIDILTDDQDYHRQATSVHVFLNRATEEHWHEAEERFVQQKGVTVCGGFPVFQDLEPQRGTWVGDARRAEIQAMFQRMGQTLVRLGMEELKTLYGGRSAIDLPRTEGFFSRLFRFR